MPADELLRPPERRNIRRRYRGRIEQVRIYFSKLLRLFLYQNDWKVLPMAALVAGLVGIVIRRRLFITMEGTLISSLAIACVCLWNGCFNSIQVICRERDIVKREHRSGMHISSYIAAHMIYQALLCLLQSAITISVMTAVGVRFPSYSLITGHFLTEFFLSLFFITYAADMMSLWISAFCHTTTAAMTVMPVVLIFQLVFSGGLMSLPARLEPISDYVISNMGLSLIAAEADYNNLETTTAWNAVLRMKNNEISGSVTLGRVVELLEDTENTTIQKIRAIEVMNKNSIFGKLTVGDIADILNDESLGAEELKKREFPYSFTIGDLLNLAGEDRVRDYIVENTSKAAQNPEYAYDAENIVVYWELLLVSAFIFAFGAMITLEFIDRDKR